MFVPLLIVATIAQATPAAQAASAPPQPRAVAPAAPAAAGAYVPQRVYDTRRNAFTDFEAMLADLVSADVVFVGEQHDDPNTHRLEHALLLGLLRRTIPVTVSLEMFERDVQGPLDAYLAGTLPEEEFLKNARPWPRYASDYRPLVETARSHGWRVIAANVPRRLAAVVAKSGKGAVDEAATEDRPFIARELQCPADTYYTRFADQMGAHPAGGGQTPSEEQRAAQQAMVERYYWSQCLKDETMAESIAAAFQQADRKGPIVHFNGAFHSDFGLGTADRVRRRLPGRRIVVLTMRPVESLDALAPGGDDLKIADYVVYTVK